MHPNVGSWTCSRTMHVYIKCLPQICTKMNGFKFDFSKNFWAGAHRAPSPDISRFFLGFALGSGFALNSQALHAFDSGFALDSRVLRAFNSGFALDSRALHTLDSGFALTFRLENLVWPPKINSWIRPWLGSSCLYPWLPNPGNTKLFWSM